MSFTVINFYKFVELSDLPDLRQTVKALAQARNILGTVLLAPEGINASLSGDEAALKDFVEEFKKDPRFADVSAKYSVGQTAPFHKLCVKLKRWIIRFAEAQDPSLADTVSGSRIDAFELRQILETNPDDVIVVDTRNDYEFAYGTFRGARTLPIRRFTEFPEVFQESFKGQEDKTFVFFCTGGVRCEKVVPWAEQQGFKKSFQLDGGILDYFKKCGGENYVGDCFVFDERWMLAPELSERPGCTRPGHYPKRPGPGRE